jgi:HK97 family phage major capsid protein
MRNQLTDLESISNIGLSRKELADYSFSRAVNAVMTSDWSKAGLERAASEATARAFGKQPDGFFIPPEFRYQRAFTAAPGGGADSLINTKTAVTLVDALRANMVLGMAGATILPDLKENGGYPIKNTSTTVYPSTETATVTPSNLTTGRLNLKAKRVSAVVNATKAYILTAAESAVITCFEDAASQFGAQIENQFFNGSGTTPYPTGLFNQSGIGAVIGGTNGAQINWNHLLGLESSCAVLNAEPNSRAAYIVNPASRTWMKKTPQNTYQRNIWNDSNNDYPLNGYRAGVTQNIPSNLTKNTSTGVCSAIAFSSDWSNAVIGLFGPVDVVVDHFTRYDQGIVALTFNQFYDVGIFQPATFAVMVDALTA